MELIVLIVVALVALLVVLFVSSGVLYWVSNLFKVENRSFKTSVIIALASGVASVMAGVLLDLFALGFLSYIAAFFVFYYFLRRFYQTSWLKALIVFAAFGVIASSISLALAIGARSYLYEPFVVNGAGMEPTYKNGDYLFINKLDRDIARGDIVVFRFPTHASRLLIKRIIGLPSETVDVEAGKVFINRRVLDESGYLSDDTQGGISITLADDQYFMLGDNRAESADSRIYGPVSRADILGTIFFDVPGLLKNPQE